MIQVSGTDGCMLRAEIMVASWNLPVFRFIGCINSLPLRRGLSVNVPTGIVEAASMLSKHTGFLADNL